MDTEDNMESTFEVLNSNMFLCCTFVYAEGHLTKVMGILAKNSRKIVI